MDSKQLAESYALRKMIEEKLYPALRFTWYVLNQKYLLYFFHYAPQNFFVIRWLDTKNYEQVTRPWYAKALSFPFNFYYPKRYKRENEDAIHGLYENLEELEIELQVRLWEVLVYGIN